MWLVGEVSVGPRPVDRPMLKPVAVTGPPADDWRGLRPAETI